MDGGSPDDQRERNQAHIEKWGGVLVADIFSATADFGFPQTSGDARAYDQHRSACILVACSARDWQVGEYRRQTHHRFPDLPQ